LLALIVLTAVVTNGCAGERSRASHRYPDATAAEVTAAGRVLVFARERPELAVNARDYLTVIPVRLQHGDTSDYYLYAYAWSTIDKRSEGPGSHEPTHFDIVADGRRISISVPSASHAGPGLDQVPAHPPADDATLLVTPLTSETLEIMRDARELQAIADADGSAARYELWDDRRGSLAAFLQGSR
jgi:hypothetical protein